MSPSSTSATQSKTLKTAICEDYREVTPPVRAAARLDFRAMTDACDGRSCAQHLRTKVCNEPWCDAVVVEVNLGRLMLLRLLAHAPLELMAIFLAAHDWGDPKAMDTDTVPVIEWWCRSFSVVNRLGLECEDCYVCHNSSLLLLDGLSF
jgi:hypothetical protein